MNPVSTEVSQTKPSQCELSRRDFVSSIAVLSAASTIGPFRWHAAARSQQGANPPQMPLGKHYRAVSWWLTWADLVWPTPELMDRVKRRADHLSENGANCCLIFGAHFRWDFMPLWDRLHDLLRFVAEELHQREILLFDHHSSVLTHRPRSKEEGLNIWRKNSHHVPFYPSLKAAEALEFNGSRLNSWRMLDVETGEPVYLPAYNAEQFCMNNPEFRDAYTAYLRKLIAETGIDGLMSDDNIFYGGWRTCGCPHCRKRFRADHGHELPPATDYGFWGNRESKAFRDWIRMRFTSSGAFLGIVKNALPSGFPLLSCCSSSDGWSMPAHGMSYQDFIKNTNLIMLEMTGSTPSLTGTWDERTPSQMLHLGIGGKHNVPCLGLGYGYFPDTAFFIWALNKFLGSDSWFSTLKGRLNGTSAELNALADDSELVGEGYRWEKAHPQLFAGKVDTNAAVFFSRVTRDLYGQCVEDYARDYQAVCLGLMRANITFEVLADLPPEKRIAHLVLPSAICLSTNEQRLLREYMNAGGCVIATGPTGWYDNDMKEVEKSILKENGIHCEQVEPSRAGAFPPYSNLKAPIAVSECRVSDEERVKVGEGWFEARVGEGRLLWRPERISTGSAAAAAVVKFLSGSQAEHDVRDLPKGWRVRRYRDGNRIILHGLPGKVGTVLHDSSLQNAFTGQRLVENLVYTPLLGELSVKSNHVKNLVLYSPDLPEPRSGKHEQGRWSLSLSGISRYFVVELSLY